MNKNAWIVAVVVALVFGGGGYYFGKQSATSATPTGAAAYAGRTGATGRTGSFAGGAGFGGGTTGTIISTGNGTLTIQMAASTSTTATTGTKIVLFDTSTMVNELESVPASTLAVGQSIVVTGTANSDGSVTATSIQVRPAGMGSRTGAVPTATQ
jgi:hypothetical protein